jgi:hypothetical protein
MSAKLIINRDAPRSTIPTSVRAALTLDRRAFITLMSGARRASGLDATSRGVWACRKRCKSCRLRPRHRGTVGGALVRKAGYGPEKHLRTRCSTAICPRSAMRRLS